jgi:hypothetical protein
MLVSSLAQKCQTRRSVEVNEGPKLVSDNLIPSGGFWVGKVGYGEALKPSSEREVLNALPAKQTLQAGEQSLPSAPGGLRAKPAPVRGDLSRTERSRLLVRSAFKWRNARRA